MSKDIKKSLSYNQVTKGLQNEAVKLKSITLSDRQVCDLELILNGAFSPIKGFMNKQDYDSVLKNMRLENGELWPMPINLDLNKKTIEAYNIKTKSKLSLRDKEGFLIAIITVNDIWKVDKSNEANCIYSSNDKNHPGVNYLYNKINDYYIGGSLEQVQLPHHYDYQLLRHTPKELKEQFK